MPKIDCSAHHHPLIKKDKPSLPAHAHCARNRLKLKHQKVPTPVKPGLTRIKPAPGASHLKHNKTAAFIPLKEPAKTAKQDIGELVSEMIDLHKRSERMIESIRPQSNLALVNLPILNEIKHPDA